MANDRASVADGLAPQRLGRFRVLRVEGRTVFASVGLSLFSSADAGLTFDAVGGLPRAGLRRVLSRNSLASRLLREGFHCLAPTSGEDIVAAVRGAIVRKAPGNAAFEIVHRLERGSRPLNLCRAESGRLYFGEYFANAERDEVHVYGSDDGRRWSVVHTFPRGRICHVHGIHRDPHRGGLWVLTGDLDHESGLWWTADEFQTLEPVFSGSQRARAASIVPLEDGILVPMDSADEPNRVQLLQPESGVVETLAEVPGSVLAMARTPSLFLLSTAVETSAVNLDQRAALFASRNGLDWRLVSRFHRDLPWVRDHRNYLQYPTLLLPDGASELPFMFATGQSLAGLHGSLLRYPQEEVLALLSAGVQES